MNNKKIINTKILKLLVVLFFSFIKLENFKFFVGKSLKYILNNLFYELIFYFQRLTKIILFNNLKPV